MSAYSVVTETDKPAIILKKIILAIMHGNQ